MTPTKCFLIAIAVISLVAIPVFGGESVKLGLNYPKTGPYHVQGLDQWRAANMAVEEINAAGGILGKQVELVWTDSKSNADDSKAHAVDLIDNQGVKMIFGGSSSGVACAVGDVCQEKGVPFFGTLTYSTATTGKRGHRHTFRECYDAWMGAKAIGDYLNSKFAGKKYMYITADYTWGWTTESSVRKFTNTDDKDAHKGVLTPLGTKDFAKQLSLVKMIKPDVLVLVLFGQDMVNAIRQATSMGLKNSTQIVVPNLTLGMAEGGGPKVMEGVIGALPWCWQVPYKYGYDKGKKFVEAFAAKHNRYPSTSGASAYTIVHQYKEACERAGSFDAPKVITALEGHEYTSLKDKQWWRKFDHQSVQAVFAVKCKPQVDVMKDKFHLDYFEILSRVEGAEAAISKAEWEAVRAQNNLPSNLEPLKSMATR
ncbi:MAG: substrate-binding protein [candidate division Zixibacteria bacterium]|nr:substrate-binding protein [candidate division Zixibacteria bacterium]MDH3938990.1 substrate-binding protein [candidate division Zixibacteria bacterium]MDH4032397.1 substrate-binding protein [candidate division Zixibacteria bacterium]